MSYCVNCGVELAPSEKNCPLCDVEVLNPKDPWRDPETYPYPHRVDKVVTHVERKFGVWLASLFLLIPSIVTLIINLMTDFRISWSAYVIGSCMVVFVLVLFPLLFKKPIPLLFLGLDYAMVLLFLWSLNYYSETATWFVPLALPIATSVFAVAGIIVFMLRLKDYPLLFKAAAILASFGILCVAINVTLDAHHGLPLAPDWSLIALAPCLIISVMLIFTERHQKIKDSIRRRLFY